MKVKEISPCSFHIDVDWIKNQKWRQYLLWIADAHFDSVYCRKDLLRKDLKKAEELNAIVIIGGDFLDLMQGKDDKRNSKTELASELKSSDYVNRIINKAVDFLEPYKKNIVLMLKGNHELSFQKKHEIDIVRLIGEKLGVKTGGYSNYIRILFKGGGNSSRGSLIYHSHSSGSVGKRSKGILSVDILAGEYPDADIYVTEHSHSSYVASLAVERCNQLGNIHYQQKLFLQMPTYKAEWEDQDRSNWWMQNNMKPRPLGGYFIEYSFERKNQQLTTSVKLSV